MLKSFNFVDSNKAMAYDNTEVGMDDVLSFLLFFQPGGEVDGRE